MFKHPVALLSVLTIALGVAACGGSGSSATHSAATSAGTSSSSGGGAAQVLTLAADPSGALKYDKSTLAANAGKVTIKFTNDSPMQHNVTVQQGTSGAVLGSTHTFSGGTESVTLNLKAGKYTYYCSVPGHRAAGMLGTLSVK